MSDPIPGGQHRIVVTKAEAAERLSMSIDSLERYVIPEIKVIRRGKLVLIPARELERWADEQGEGLI